MHKFDVEVHVEEMTDFQFNEALEAVQAIESERDAQERAFVDALTFA